MSVFKKFFPKNRYLTKAKEHKLPIINEKKEETRASAILNLKLSIKASLLKILINHLIDKPLGGKMRSAVELNDVITKIMSGMVIDAIEMKEISLNENSMKETLFCIESQIPTSMVFP